MVSVVSLGTSPLLFFIFLTSEFGLLKASAKAKENSNCSAYDVLNAREYLVSLFLFDAEKKI